MKKFTFCTLFLCLAFVFQSFAKEFTFTVLPSGDLKRKSDKQSEQDLQRYTESLSERGNERCSRGVREAIKAEYGIDIFDSAKPGDLTIYNGRYTATLQGLDHMLKRNGYEVVNPKGYIPQKGDVQGIAYLKPIQGRRGLAHAQYYDGKSWISDHQQSASYANSALLSQVGLTANDIIVVTYRRKK